MIAATILLVVMLGSSHGFTTENYCPKCPPTRNAVILASYSTNDSSPLDGIIEGAKKRFKIAQESNARGASIKQTIAEVIASEYDGEAAKKEINEAVASAPCVVFSWGASPSCKDAFAALDMAGVKQLKTVPLDDPWEEGNKLRAELGKMLGQSSVPAIFIGGEYVGGYSGGPSEKAPGILKLAFQGELQPLLEKAGAL